MFTNLFWECVVLVEFVVHATSNKLMIDCPNYWNTILSFAAQMQETVAMTGPGPLDADNFGYWHQCQVEGWQVGVSWVRAARDWSKGWMLSPVRWVLVRNLLLSQQRRRHCNLMHPHTLPFITSPVLTICNFSHVQCINVCMHHSTLWWET